MKNKRLNDATLFDICMWLTATYPADIFDGSSKDKGVLCVTKMVREAKKILKMKLTMS